MTTTMHESLREAISAEQLSRTEIWGTVTAAARDLASALKAGDLDECERAARYIADISAYLKPKR